LVLLLVLLLIARSNPLPGQSRGQSPCEPEALRSRAAPPA
jgi:hypothetical protein